jgi:hypothetical protein
MLFVCSCIIEVGGRSVGVVRSRTKATELGGWEPYLMTVQGTDFPYTESRVSLMRRHEKNISYEINCIVTWDMALALVEYVSTHQRLWLCRM